MPRCSRVAWAGHPGGARLFTGAAAHEKICRDREMCRFLSFGAVSGGKKAKKQRVPVRAAVSLRGMPCLPGNVVSRTNFHGALRIFSPLLKSCCGSFAACRSRAALPRVGAMPRCSRVAWAGHPGGARLFTGAAAHEKICRDREMCRFLSFGAVSGGKKAKKQRVPVRAAVSLRGMPCLPGKVTGKVLVCTRHQTRHQYASTSFFPVKQQLFVPIHLPAPVTTSA